MKYSEASIGRVFILKLEEGDIIPEVIESFARSQGIKSAVVHFLGGADRDSKVVVGPEDSKSQKIRPMVVNLSGTSESVGMGTIFVNEEGIPKLHMHAAFGRSRDTVTGCTREGVKIWFIAEAVILELTKTSAQRRIDSATGFEVLDF
jgi:predicted DNA-binding protein with PD1-like motif